MLQQGLEVCQLLQVSSLQHSCQLVTSTRGSSSLLRVRENATSISSMVVEAELGGRHDERYIVVYVPHACAIRRTESKRLRSKARVQNRPNHLDMLVASPSLLILIHQIARHVRLSSRAAKPTSCLPRDTSDFVVYVPHACAIRRTESDGRDYDIHMHKMRHP